MIKIGEVPKIFLHEYNLLFIIYFNLPSHKVIKHLCSSERRHKQFGEQIQLSTRTWLLCKRQSATPQSLLSELYLK